MAFIDGRSYVIPDDAKELSVAVLAHRIQMRGGIHGSQRDELEAIVHEITSKVALPT